MREYAAYLKIAVFISLNIIFLFKGFCIFYDKWFWWGSYYSHSPLVVAAFIWLLVKRAKDYKPALEKHPFHISGIVIIFISIAMYLFGLWKNFPTFVTWGMLVFVIGNAVLFLSKNFVIKNIGIFIYLLLAIPVPQIAIDSLTFELQLFASYLSENVISLIYPSTFRNGNILQVNGHYISITYECSGLSNLLSMLSAVWLMALFQTKKIITVIDYLISIPAAIISNILRIVIVTILVVNGYEQFALNDWHSEIGIIVFIFIVILIVIFNELPFKKDDFHFKISFTGLVSHINKNNKLLNIYIIFLIILSFVSFVIPDKNNFHNSGAEILLKDIIPDSIGNWKSRNEILGENYFNVLGTNDLLMRAFWEKGKSPENNNVYLYIIRSKDNAAAFHRPEACLRGEGYELSAHNEVDLILINKKIIPVHRTLFVDKDKGLLVYYWYYINGKNIKDTLRYQLEFLFNMNDDSSGSFIRISKPVNLNKITQEEQKMKQFANEIIPEILKYL
ncbi:MAG: exosortase C-terminal domain/associated protein EpsI [Spirochaetota bacterium]